MEPLSSPLAFVVRHLSLIPVGGRVLDLAAGGGRHTRLCLDAGFAVTAIDRETAALADLTAHPRCRVIEADLEAAPWPLPGEVFDGIIVTNYLWRPLFPVIGNSLEPSGILLYETFMAGNERFGRPSNPDFLLRPGELRSVFTAGFDILVYEEREDETPGPAVRQALAARKL